MLRLLFRRFAAAPVALFVLTCTTTFAQKTIHVPADQLTIQAAIDAANTGDTVLVAPGIYHENLKIDTKEITLRSSDGAATTIIDGSRAGIVITITNTPSLATTIDGFTIRNGATNYTPSDGGIYVSIGGATIQNNTISGNYGWGIDAGGGSVNVFSNHFITTAPNAGQPYCSGQTAIYLFGNLHAFTSNDIPDHISGNLIEGDGSRCSGDGIYALAIDSAIIENNTIRNNSYGMWMYAVHATVRNNLIYGNEHGGLYAEYELGVFPRTDPPEIFIVNNSFFNNLTDLSTQNIYGQQHSGEVVLDYLYAKMVLSNNLIIGTSSTSPTLACLSDGGTGGFDSNDTPAIIDHNDIFNSNASPYPLVLGQCSDTQPTEIGLDGNISANPLFASSTDFHLLPGSPAIDTGNNSAIHLPATDLSGGTRIADSTGLGYPVVDMGVYESAGLPDAIPSFLSLVSSSYYVTPKSSITLAATPMATGGAPNGVINFFQDDKPIGSTTVAAGGAATQAVTLLNPGLYRFKATYTSSAGYSPAVSTVLYVRVTVYVPKLTLSSTPNPSILGQIVNFNVTISSPDNDQLSPITLADGNNVLATLTPDATGSATFATSSLALGFHTITASYAGDTMHGSATATVTQQVISGYPTSITLTASPNPSISGQNVTFTATVASSNGTPTGTVQFTDGATILGTQPINASGIATLSISTLSVGIHPIYATYIPTGSFAGTSASIEQTVNAITDAVNLTSSLNPSSYGQPVTITAHIVPSNGMVASGSVTFVDGGQFLAVQPVDASGNAAITLSDLAVRGHIITGTFTPSGSTLTFSGSLTQYVNGLSTATVLSAAPLTGVAHITPVTLTAAVTSASGGPNPTGQVLFYLNGAQLNLATLVNGVATYTGTLPAGIDQIYARYVGETGGVYDGSNSNTVSVTITAAPSTLSLTSSLNPAPALTPFSLSAQLALASGGAIGAGYPITFTIAPTTTAQAATNASGTATYTSAGLLPGQYLVTATFAGTTDLQPSTATAFIETITANPTATTLTASPNPGIQNNPVTFTSTVTALTGAASPAGTITIYDSLSPSTAFTPIATLTIPSTAGSTTATFTTTALAPGTHILYSAFTPAAGFAPSQSAQFTLVIQPQSFTLTLSDPTLTVQTGHHRTETATLTSIGGLTGTFTLSCGTLPQYTSCAWGKGSVTLPANGTVSSSLTIDTDQLIGFLASNTGPTPGAPAMARCMRQEWAVTSAFALFPLTLLGFRRRRNLRSLLPILVLAALASTLTACGANQYPYSTPPGTYTVHVTAAGPPAPGGVSPTQTVDLTLIVTR